LNLSEASLTNPSTTYVADLDPGVNVVYPDGTYIAYGYVYDQHNLLASAPQSESWTVNNVAPVISIDGFNTTTVTLTESTTSDLIASVTVTDANSCQDITIGGSVIVDFFGNWLDGDYQVDNDHPLCNSLEHSNPDKCYPAISCVVDNSTNSCAGISDNQVAYTCTVPVQYHAEATGIGAIDSNHINGNWYAYITATDDDGLYSIDSVTNLNVDLLIAFSAEDAINYGSISSGYSSLTNPTVSVTSTGNTKIDVEVGSTNQSGESYVPGDYLMCTDYPTCSGDNFHIDNQQYFTSAFSHGTGIVLREPADPDYPLKLALAVAKTHWTSSLQIGTKNIYWSLYVPVGTPVGNYSGSNTLIAVQADW
jgi:hypothetical protein